MTSIRSITTAVNEAFQALYHMCESDSRASRLLDRALDAAYKGERAHRAMGARFTGGRAGYRGSALTAARYFVVLRVATGAGPGSFEHVTSYLEAAELREDVFLAYALRQLLQGPVQHRTLKAEQVAAFKVWALRTRAALEPVDYARDFAVPM